jgi:hypothetical protein
MQRASLTEQGLRLALAALASLAIAPVAAADDGLLPLDPAAMATELAAPAVSDLPAADPAEVAAMVAETAPVPSPNPPTEAVPAAAAEPMQALEPQPTPIGTPPPPQPADPQPTPAPDPYTTSSDELAPPPSPQPEPVEEPQYQPEPPQYQPSEPAPAPDAPPSAPPSPQSEWSWDWAWDCSDGGAPSSVPPLPGEGMPTAWTWNWNWNCGNNDAQNGGQYHGGITRYHPINVNVSIRIGSPGDNGPVTQTNVIIALAARPLAAAAQGVTAAITEAVAPMAASVGAIQPDSSAAAAPGRASAAPKPAGRTGAAGAAAAPPAPTPLMTISSTWTPRLATPRRVQPKPEIHRSRSSHRKPTRRPHPPLRGPAIPVSSSGAAPLGGADGGGFHLALLLVPFALALVDSVRRKVRDAAPPVVRELDKRLKRPG